jgi:hypothetical protein
MSLGVQPRIEHCRCLKSLLARARARACARMHARACVRACVRMCTHAVRIRQWPNVHAIVRPTQHTTAASQSHTHTHTRSGRLTGSTACVTTLIDLLSGADSPPAVRSVETYSTPGGSAITNRSLQPHTHSQLGQSSVHSIQTLSHVPERNSLG